MYVTEKEKGKLGGKRTLKREKEKSHFFLNLYSEKGNFQFFPKIFLSQVSKFLPKRKSLQVGNSRFYS
jgi:hypothetical protein